MAKSQKQAAKTRNPETFVFSIYLCHVFVDVPWAMWQEARMSLRTFVPGPGTQYIGHTASYYVAN